MANEEVWLERVVAWRQSGQSAARFCEAQSYDAGSLRGWSSRLGREGKVARSALGRRAKHAQQSAVAFARVVTKAAHAPNASPLVAAGRDALVVVIGPTRVEIAPGFDPELLRSVVAALATGGA
jgi:hypothetical protein